MDSIEEKNLLKAIQAALNNSYHINIFFPLLITKTNLYDSGEVNQLFELFASVCEKFSKNKKSLKLYIE